MYRTILDIVTLRRLIFFVSMQNGLSKTQGPAMRNVNTKANSSILHKCICTSKQLTSGGLVP